MTTWLNRRALASLGLGMGVGLMSTNAAARQRSEGGLIGTRHGRKTRVAILIYPGATMLDWIGPYEAMHRIDGFEILLVGKTTNVVKSDSGIVDYKANLTFDEVATTDVLLIPGGAKEMLTAAADPQTADWIRRMDAVSSYTVGICTGALFLARLGLLDGRRATTYWKFTPMLSGFGATFVPERWTQDGKYWTSAGVMAGVDLTIALIAEIYGRRSGQMAQLAIEYDPDPPFDTGSVRTAPQDIIDALGGVVATPGQ